MLSQVPLFYQLFGIWRLWKFEKFSFLKVYAKTMQGEGRSLVFVVIAARFVI